MKQGITIGKYKVVFSLEQRGYYQVFRVADEANNKFLLRLINLAKLEDTQIEGDDWTVSEIQIASNIHHANIMDQIDSGECIVDGQRYAYSVYDFIPSETLADKLKREHICSVYEVKLIVLGILNSLKYLHSKKTPIIYNGVSPSNVILDLSSSTPKALLWGFSHAKKLGKAKELFYVTGLSPFYLAPEMFKGLFSTRTDLYAVGTLMYQMLFGILPWHVELRSLSKDKWEEAILTARKYPLPIPDIKMHELDEDLLNTLAKALNQDVDQRFQSADEFIQALTGTTAVASGSYEYFDPSPQEQEEKAKAKAPKKGNGFADVAGMDSLKERLQEEVIDLLRNPEKYKKLRVKMPNGILFYGPPGCGKTYIAEKFAEELNCNYMYVHCSDVASPYIHGGQEKISALFQQARDNAPTVLFLDELDAMLANRSRHTNVSESGEVNEFLAQLNNVSDDGVLVIGATNKPDLIDPAALRSGRIDIKVYIPAPDAEEREALLKLSLKGIAADDVDYGKLANMTQGYVSKDICVLVNKAALLAAKGDRDTIDMSTLLSAINKSKADLPSISATELQEYETIRAKFESKVSSRRPIGFGTSNESITY